MKSLLWIPVIVSLMTACTKNKSSQGAGQAESDQQAVVYASNYPLWYFANRIADGAVEVRLAPPSGIDPAYWKPTSKDIESMQQAELLLLNGASYESWLSTVSLPTSRLLDTSQSFNKELITLQGNETHSHGPGGEHAHAGTAFTTWLDFSLSIQQAKTIHQSLIRRWPEHESDFTKAYDNLRQDLESLDREFKLVTSNNQDLPVLFSHPVYQYAERRYGINGHSLHWEPGELPSGNMWQELHYVLEKHPAKWMLWEAQPLPAVVERLKGMGIECVVFSPCSTAPEQRDFLSVMQENLKELDALYKNE